MSTGWTDSGTTPYTIDALHLGDTLRWESLGSTGGPPAYSLSTAVLDGRHDRILVFGGFRMVPEGETYDKVYTDEVWSLSLTDLTWSLIGTSGVGPRPMAGHSAVFDPVHDRMIVFGGWRPSSGYSSETWELSLSGRPRWKRIDFRGESPEARSGHVAIYDSRERRMVVVSGVAEAPSPGPARFLNDVWALSLTGRSEWRRILPDGGPFTMYADLGASYDAESNRALIGSLQCLLALDWDEPSSPVVASDLPRPAFEGARATPLPSEAQIGDEEVRLYDVAGRLVLTHVVQDATTWLRRLGLGSSVEGVPMVRGVYFARVRNHQGELTTKRVLLLR